MLSTGTSGQKTFDPARRNDLQKGKCSLVTPALIYYWYCINATTSRVAFFPMEPNYCWCGQSAPPLSGVWRIFRIGNIDSFETRFVVCRGTTRRPSLQRKQAPKQCFCYS